MVKRITDKKITPLEVIFEDVFVCRQNNLKPFLEIFIQKPENIEQESLGVIAGILEITDTSEESSYVVNYLISVIKKEYFSRPKRGPVESFEAALHKANLALAQLAEHANIGWLGKINAILMVAEKNSIHFSQTGKSHALLLRNKIITDVVEEDFSAAPPNPLKTFTDVVSGRLEKDDKLILTTHHIFDIFSLEEIKKSLLKFTPAEFVRFLKTALGNELELAAVLFSQVQEKKVATKTAPPAKSKNVNVFSQKTFSKKPPRKHQTENENKSETESSEILNELSNIQKDVAKANGNFVDQKTGHIYIKEDSTFKEDPAAFISIQEKIEDYKNASKNFFATTLEKVKNGATKSKEETTNTFSPKTETRIREKFKNNVNYGEVLARAAYKLQLMSSDILFFLKNTLLPIVKKFSLFIWRKTLSAISSIIHLTIELFGKLKEKRKFEAPLIAAPNRNTSAFLIAWPRFSRLKEIVSHLSARQKSYAGLILLLLFIVPYFIAKFTTKPEPAPTAQKETPPAFLPLENDKAVVRTENITSVYAGENVQNVMNLNENFFAVNATGVIDIFENKSYPFPDGFSPRKSTGMDDLNFIFFLGQNGKILSWSPISKKFEDNIAELPSESSIDSISTYLTYLYVLSSADNQIYRYPRETGGFGQKTSWLKNGEDASATASMAIGENIYLGEKNNVLKFFQGKKQDFTLESSATPIEISKLYTKRDGQFLYILDTTNARVVKAYLNGKIIAQYYNAEIKKATDFTVDEKNNLIYISSDSGVSTLKMD